jgi:leucine dehydrogenase
MSCQQKEKSAVSTNKNSELEVEKIDVPGYESVLKFTNKKAKLTAFIAIHNTALGMALGGTRIYPYATLELALTDVLRLSRGMTYKAAVSEVGFGGGKSVIVADPKTQKTPELLKAFAEAVHSLEGKYICAEDVGSSLADMAAIGKETPYVVGLPHETSSGDPGPFTAFGVYRGIQAVCKKVYGTESVKGRVIAIQGLGNVGWPLLERLFWAGAKIIVSDIVEERIKKAKQLYQVEVVSSDQIMRVSCDVFSPCAMGGILHETSIKGLSCKAVAGSANNQLLKEEDGDLLRERNILYAPDFVINAGGLLNVAQETYKEGYNPKRSREKIDKIYDGLLAIFDIAEKNKVSTHKAAVSLAEYRIQYGIGKRAEKPCFHHFSKK